MIVGHFLNSSVQSLKKFKRNSDKSAATQACGTPHPCNPVGHQSLSFFCVTSHKGVALEVLKWGDVPPTVSLHCCLFSVVAQDTECGFREVQENPC